MDFLHRFIVAHPAQLDSILLISFIFLNHFLSVVHFNNLLFCRCDWCFHYFCFPFAAIVCHSSIVWLWLLFSFFSSLESLMDETYYYWWRVWLNIHLPFYEPNPLTQHSNKYSRQLHLCYVLFVIMKREAAKRYTMCAVKVLRLNFFNRNDI